MMQRLRPDEVQGRCEVMEKAAREAKASVHAWAGRSARLHREVLEGPVAEAILQAAGTRKSDIMVMGSRGLSGLQGALLGSNSQKVVNHAACPVLLAR